MKKQIITRPRPITYAALSACLVFLALLTASCSYQGNEARDGKSSITVTPVFKPRVLRANLQVNDLGVTVNSNGTAILWSKISLGFPSDIGLAGVDNDGKLSYRREITSLESVQEPRPTPDEEPDDSARPVATNVIDEETALIVLSRLRLSDAAGVPERRELTLRLLKSGEFIGEPTAIKDADLAEDSKVYFVDERETRFSLFWENATSVRHQTFRINAAEADGNGAHDQSVSKLSPAVAVTRRQGLSAVDPSGNLYFAKVRNGEISVTKTDSEGKVLLSDMSITKRTKVGDRLLPPNDAPAITAGPSSFAVTWTSTQESSPAVTHSYLQQVSAVGELLGETAEMKTGDAGGMRVATTHGETIIDDIYASTRRLKQSLGMTSKNNKELTKLYKKEKPLFKNIGDKQNKEVLETAMKFMDRSSKTTYGSTMSYGFMDDHGNTIDADMTRISTETVVISLADTDPLILVDFYREGRLLKTIDMGRGEDVALAAINHDLIATWTGGNGWVDLTIARWRLSAR